MGYVVKMLKNYDLRIFDSLSGSRKMSIDACGTVTVDSSENNCILECASKDYIPANVRADENIPKGPPYFIIRYSGNFLGIESRYIFNDVEYSSSSTMRVVHFLSPVIYCPEDFNANKGQVMDICESMLKAYFIAELEYVYKGAPQLKNIITINDVILDNPEIVYVKTAADI